MTLREEYQAKVDLANRLLKKKKYRTEVKSDNTPEENQRADDLIHLKEIYEYRIEAIDRRQKAREKEDKKDQVNNYKEMLQDIEESAAELIRLRDKENEKKIR